MEEVLLDTMYELPSRTDIARVVIDEDVVIEKVNPTLIPVTELGSSEAQERSA
jgi:ATP-dependent Clp protease ATP-binding subunit ClpX